MDTKAFIIAEIGINHNGSLNRAKKMIRIAKKSGADAVKFQSYITGNLVTKSEKQMPYQLKNNKRKISQFKMLKNSELDFRQQLNLKKYCKFKNIEFISTPYDETSAKYLCKIGVKKIKIASTDITNVPFLKFILKLKKEVIISTGATSLDELKEIFNVIFKKNLKNKITILQCTAFYPCNEKELNINSIKVLREKFKTNVGFSDHSLSLVSGALAYAAGAKVIEKHFTLNKKMIGPDHKSSLSPTELKKYIKNIRDAEIMMGSMEKKIQKSEKLIKSVIQKSIFLKKNILKGYKIKKKDTIIMRPSTSIKPKFFEKIIGKKAKKNLKAYTILKNSNFI